MSKESKLISWIEEMASHALAALGLEMRLQICLEPIGKRFNTLDNACEITENRLFVNSDWLEQQRAKADETEVRIIIYHEMRHIYQDVGGAETKTAAANKRAVASCLEVGI